VWAATPFTRGAYPTGSDANVASSAPMGRSGPSGAPHCRGMAEVSQVDFARAVRGSLPSALDGEIEPIIGGISSIARCAVRDVHRKSPQAAMAYFNGRTAKWALLGGSAASAVRTYHDSLAQYIAWDGGSGSADLDIGLRAGAIVYAPGDGVRAFAHVVRDLGSAGREVRVLFWDELPLDRPSAEMIALPVLDRIDGMFGVGATAQIDVWQLARPHRFTVLPATARTHTTAVQQLLSTL